MCSASRPASRYSGAGSSRRVEGIVRESVRPMEKIEGIRILQVDGLHGGNGGNGGNGGRSATDEVIDSALRYRVQAPLIDSLLADIGIEGALFENAGTDPRGAGHAGNSQGHSAAEEGRRGRSSPERRSPSGAGGSPRKKS